MLAVNLHISIYDERGPIADGYTTVHLKTDRDGQIDEKDLIKVLDVITQATAQFRRVPGKPH